MLFYTTVYEMGCVYLLEAELHVFERLCNEIRNPITAVSGLTELINEWPNLTDEQKVCIDDMNASVGKLTKVVTDLLTFSMYQKHVDATDVEQTVRDEEEKEAHMGVAVDFNIRDAVDSALAHYLPLAEKARLQVYTDIPADLPRHVFGDCDRLTGVLDQLLSNAIKFTPCGCVTIEVDCMLSGDFLQE